MRTHKYPRNADGTYRLRDLRDALRRQDPHTTLRRQSGQWIVCRWSDGFRAWIESPLHYSVTTERAALVAALRIGEEEG